MERSMVNLPPPRSSLAPSWAGDLSERARRRAGTKWLRGTERAGLPLPEEPPLQPLSAPTGEPEFRDCSVWFLTQFPVIVL